MKKKNERENNFIGMAVSASNGAMTADITEEELRKMKKMQLVKLGAILALSASIIVFLTLGWFSSNKLIGATNGSVRVGTDQFDIATKGSSLSYSELIKGYDSGYDEGVVTTISETAYRAAGSKDRLMLRFDTDVGEIAPGGKDSLNLYVIPKSNNAQNVKVTLNVVPFA